MSSELLPPTKSGQDGGLALKVNEISYLTGYRRAVEGEGTCNRCESLFVKMDGTFHCMHLDRPKVTRLMEVSRHYTCFDFKPKLDLSVPDCRFEESAITGGV